MRKKVIDNVVQDFIAALSCVIGDEKAIYASTPITNGPLLLEKVASDRKLLQLTEAEFSAYVFREIVPVNEDGANRFINKIRTMGLGVVINPSSFFSEELTQEEYLILWGEVIIKFAKAVWFNSGWEFSKGCVTEYCIAIENGIPTFNETGRELSVPQAVDQIEKAIDGFSAVGIDVGTLEKKINRLKKFRGNRQL